MKIFNKQITPCYNYLKHLGEVIVLEIAIVLIRGESNIATHLIRSRTLTGIVLICIIACAIPNILFNKKAKRICPLTIGLTAYQAIWISIVDKEFSNTAEIIKFTQSASLEELIPLLLISPLMITLYVVIRSYLATAENNNNKRKKATGKTIDSLPNKFKTKQYLKRAQANGIGERTAEKQLAKLVADNIVRKGRKQGRYNKN